MAKGGLSGSGERLVSVGPGDGSAPGMDKITIKTSSQTLNVVFTGVL